MKKKPKKGDVSLGVCKRCVDKSVRDAMKETPMPQIQSSEAFFDYLTDIKFEVAEQIWADAEKEIDSIFANHGLKATFAYDVDHHVVDGYIDQLVETLDCAVFQLVFDALTGRIRKELKGVKREKGQTAESLVDTRLVAMGFNSPESRPVEAAQ